ncbi:circadian clock protein KaiB [Synechococcus moorigangaii CMS01]|nr:circadian clock protein KaiB [Synechococcus moorigangaii CMS01]
MASDSSNDPLLKMDSTPPIHHKQHEFYVLYLYVAGSNSHSRWAINELESICREYLPNRHEIRIIDIYEHPDLAESERIVATPTLIKKLPPPLRKFIGDLSDRESILIGLDIW